MRKTELHTLKEGIIIGFKSILQYRVNFYSSLLVYHMDIIASIFLLYVFTQVAYIDFPLTMIIFFILIRLLWTSFFTSMTKTSFSLFPTLTKGEMNIFLTRPSPPYLLYLARGYRTRWLIISGYTFILFSLFILYNELSYLKFLGVLCTSIIFSYSYFSIYQLFDSLSFFYIKPNTQNLYRTNRQLASYPPTFYEQFNYRFIFFLFPMVLHGVATLYYFGELSLLYYIIVLSIALIVSLIINFSTYIMWKYGLKKYEAFG